MNTSRKNNIKQKNTARYLRKNMTPEEKHLWYDYLSKYPVKFLRQKIIDNYIVDFYCHDARLVIEIDGIQHTFPNEEERDAERTKAIEQRNLYVLRISNEDIKKGFDGVCKRIDKTVNQIMFGSDYFKE